MLCNLSKILDYDIAATDGVLGTVSDFLFDDASWRVRWLVVDTGHWLPGRKVLLPTFALGHLDPENKLFSVRLTRQQVKDSPDIDTHSPVSRRMEANMFDYYGWSPYWGGTDYLGYEGYVGGAMAQAPAVEPRWRKDELLEADGLEPWERHLRSANAVMGYHILAKDGEIGHVEDFVIEDAEWSIRFLIVNTNNWWLGAHVLISPRSVRQVDWQERQVSLDVTQQKVKDSPVYSDAALIDRDSEREVHRYYG